MWNLENNPCCRQRKDLETSANDIDRVKNGLRNPASHGSSEHPLLRKPQMNKRGLVSSDSRKNFVGTLTWLLRVVVAAVAAALARKVASRNAPAAASWNCGSEG